MHGRSSKNNFNVKDMRWTGWKQPERVHQVHESALYNLDYFTIDP